MRLIPLEGKLLPRVEGCIFVPSGWFLPIGDGLSFDDRYFGLVEMGEVIGEGVLVGGCTGESRFFVEENIQLGFLRDSLMKRAFRTTTASPLSKLGRSR